VSFFIRLLCVLLFLTAANLGLAERHRAKAVKAEVRFVATSSSIRSAFGASEDSYLVFVSFPRAGDEQTLARLVDQYPEYRAPVAREALMSPTARPVMLIRDRECDEALDQMPLRTAPGDPLAVLPEPLGYRPAALPRSVEPTEVLPCYRIVRH
jgi:hypothetical protein